MLFSILVGILSVFCFACGFMTFRTDIPVAMKGRIALGYFVASLVLALACRFI